MRLHITSTCSRLILVCCTFMLSAWVAAEENTVAQAAVETNTASGSRDYEIQAGDVLTISVWDEPDLQREVLVLPDQTIAFPLVGAFSIQAMSVADLAEALRGKLDRFIPQANVHVAVQQIRGNQVFVIGKVNRPGEYPMNSRLSVLQALSMAGGLSTFAKEDDIKVIRNAEEGQVAIDFVYSDVASGKSLEQNITLQNGDVVLVP